MNLGRTLRDWSAFHQPDIASSDKTERDFTFRCSSCKADIQVALRPRIEDWDMFPRHPFSSEEQEQIKAHYGMGEWSRSPCGGGIHFDIIGCPACSATYLFSYGIQEPNNGLLLLTVQGILEINNSEQAGAGQPATRSVVEPEGSDKPQPEAEGRCP